MSPGRATAQGRLEGQRLAGQFGLEDREGLGVVDVVPHRQPDHGQVGRSGPFAGRPEDARRAPGDVGEQFRMVGLQADQHVAAVARRAKHHPVPRRAQGLDRLRQKRGRQARRIRVDEDGATMALRSDQRPHRPGEHGAKIHALLQQQVEPFGQQRPEFGLSAAGA